MAKTMLNIKMDSKLKKELQKTAEVIGLPVSALMNNAARQIIEARSVTFQAPLIPNVKTARELRRSITEINSGKAKLYGPFKSGKEMTESLRK